MQLYVLKGIYKVLLDAIRGMSNHFIIQAWHLYFKHNLIVTCISRHTPAVQATKEIEGKQKDKMRGHHPTQTNYAKGGLKY